MFVLPSYNENKLLSILIQEKLIATVPKQWGCCSYFSYGFLLWTTSLIFLCRNSRLMNYFYRTTLPIGKKNKKATRKRNALNDNIYSSPKNLSSFVSTESKIPYKWIFYFCIPWDRGSYCFCKWEMKQWLIPRGLVRAHTWNAFCCRVVWHDYEEQEKK